MVLAFFSAIYLHMQKTKKQKRKPNKTLKCQITFSTLQPHKHTVEKNKVTFSACSLNKAK